MGADIPNINIKKKSIYSFSFKNNSIAPSIVNEFENIQNSSVKIKTLDIPRIKKYISRIISNFIEVVRNLYSFTYLN